MVLDMKLDIHVFFLYVYIVCYIGYFTIVSDIRDVLKYSMKFYLL